jgi:hypothetical protein
MRRVSFHRAGIVLPSPRRPCRIVAHRRLGPAPCRLFSIPLRAGGGRLPVLLSKGPWSPPGLSHRMVVLHRAPPHRRRPDVRLRADLFPPRHPSRGRENPAVEMVHHAPLSGALRRHGRRGPAVSLCGEGQSPRLGKSRSRRGALARLDRRLASGIAGGLDGAPPRRHCPSRLSRPNRPSSTEHRGSVEKAPSRAKPRITTRLPDSRPPGP